MLLIEKEKKHLNIVVPRKEQVKDKLMFTDKFTNLVSKLIIK
jgi:hypothetical protein